MLYLDHKQAKENFGDSKSTFYRKAREMEESNFYPEQTVLHGERVLILTHAYVHYTDYRKIMKVSKKNVPAFDMEKLGRILGYENISSM